MDADKDMTYTQALAELESIVSRMQADDCDIDRLAQYTARSVELLKYCKSKLLTTDEEIRRCIVELEQS